MVCSTALCCTVLYSVESRGVVFKRRRDSRGLSSILSTHISFVFYFLIDRYCISTSTTTVLVSFRHYKNHRFLLCRYVFRFYLTAANREQIITSKLFSVFCFLFFPAPMIPIYFVIATQRQTCRDWRYVGCKNWTGQNIWNEIFLYIDVHYDVISIRDFHDVDFLIKKHHSELTLSLDNRMQMRVILVVVMTTTTY
jgi:hypothetical protein